MTTKFDLCERVYFITENQVFEGQKVVNVCTGHVQRITASLGEKIYTIKEQIIGRSSLDEDVIYQLEEQDLFKERGQAEEKALKLSIKILKEETKELEKQLKQKKQSLSVLESRQQTK